MTRGLKQWCLWAGNDGLMQAYHDEEWGVPEFESRALWESLMLEGFQAGLAWIVVLRKRDEFRKVFRGFDPKKVARLAEKDVLRMLENPGIIRSRAKIEATIGGAQAFLAMQNEGVVFRRGFGRWRVDSRSKTKFEKGARCRQALRWRKSFQRS
jgi:DNA-3-methyladenine glycosylase I